ncbi:MAG: ImmA/IrrE family metallo-endopeptidase [Acutalibacteraceae bacterium]
MDYKLYQKSRDLSWDILIKEGITQLPVDVVSLCRQLGIAVKYYEPIDDNDGMCVILKDIPVIFVKSNCTRQRKRFTIAHELGHILLGHVGKYELVNREPSYQDNPIEESANVFASRLLAPACVLWGCKIETAEDIMRLCDISRQSAEYRMKRMHELYKRNKFLTTTKEQQVFEQFKDFITNHQRQGN